MSIQDRDEPDVGDGSKLSGFIDPREADQLMIHLYNPTKEEMVGHWMTAEKGSYVDLEEIR